MSILFFFIHFVFTPIKSNDLMNITMVDCREIYVPHAPSKVHRVCILLTNRNSLIMIIFIQVFVTSSDEAYKVLRVGQRNRHQAATKMNQLSSRSHAIFSMKLLKIVQGEEGSHVSRISRLSIVDLAGSERYTKTGALGELLKEASNINCSIMTLGKCISMLRYNQEHPNHPTIVPFRESKLTRLFQGYFLGKGKASMIVNISPCASIFDETYNVLKFSSVAKQVKGP